MTNEIRFIEAPVSVVVLRLIACPLTYRIRPVTPCPLSVDKEFFWPPRLVSFRHPVDRESLIHPSHHHAERRGGPPASSACRSLGMIKASDQGSPKVFLFYYEVFFLPTQSSVQSTVSPGAGLFFYFFLFFPARAPLFFFFHGSVSTAAGSTS